MTVLFRMKSLAHLAITIRHWKASSTTKMLVLLRSRSRN